MDERNIEQIAADNLAALMARKVDLDSQPKVAAKSGVGQSTIGRLLRKEGSASIGTIAAVAEAFKLRPMDLLDPQLLEAAPKLEMSNSEAPSKARHSNPYIPLLMTEAEAAEPELVKVALGILNGTIRPPDQEAPPKDYSELMSEADSILDAMTRASQAEKKRLLLAFRSGQPVLHLRQENRGPPDGVERRKEK